MIRQQAALPMAIKELKKCIDLVCKSNDSSDMEKSKINELMSKTYDILYRSAISAFENEIVNMDNAQHKFEYNTAMLFIHRIHYYLANDNIDKLCYLRFDKELQTFSDTQYANTSKSKLYDFYTSSIWYLFKLYELEIELQISRYTTIMSNSEEHSLYFTAIHEAAHSVVTYVISNGFHGYATILRKDLVLGFSTMPVLKNKMSNAIILLAGVAAEKQMGKCNVIETCGDYKEISQDILSDKSKIEYAAKQAGLYVSKHIDAIKILANILLSEKEINGNEIPCIVEALSQGDNPSFVLEAIRTIFCDGNK